MGNTFVYWMQCGRAYHCECKWELNTLAVTFKVSDKEIKNKMNLSLIYYLQKRGSEGWLLSAAKVLSFKQSFEF